MDKNAKTNRLSIYLIKKEFDSPATIFKDIDSLSAFNLDDSGTSILYTKDSYIHPPKWIENFFLKSAKDFKLKNSSSQAVFFTKISLNSDDFRYFTIPFGMGYHMLKPGIIEERFGLKVVLNTVDENQLRSIDKKNMSNVPKQSREQVAINSIVADFGIDIEQDLILGVTGKSRIEDFGKTITGKDSLSVSVKTDVNSINEFLIKCFDYYQKEDYKNSFGWIDQIAEIKSTIQIKSLNNKLIEKIKSKNLEKIWMSIPEIIEWEDVEGFNYSYNKNDDKVDDIYLPSFLKGLFSDEIFDQLAIDTFTKNQVLCYSSSTENIKHQWKAFNCLYCEIEDGNRTYLLTNGKWYQIENVFVNLINNDYRELLNKPVSNQLPEYSHENEGAYNSSVANSSNKVCLMDKKNIPYGGGYSKIEFCDLYSLDKELIHIKYYGGSSVLSHLFNQGLVSGELFKAEKGFRDKVNAELGESFKLTNTDNINAPDYKIIFAIISHVKKELDIPFFSKVSLKNAKKRLETIGYQVFLVKIPVKSDDETLK